MAPLCREYISRGWRVEECVPILLFREYNRWMQLGLFNTKHSGRTPLYIPTANLVQNCVLFIIGTLHTWIGLILGIVAYCILHISLGQCKAEHRVVRYKLKSCTVPILYRSDLVTSRLCCTVPTCVIVPCRTHFGLYRRMPYGTLPRQQKWSLSGAWLWFVITQHRGMLGEGIKNKNFLRTCP